MENYSSSSNEYSNQISKHSNPSYASGTIRSKKSSLNTNNKNHNFTQELIELFEEGADAALDAMHEENTETNNFFNHLDIRFMELDIMFRHCNIIFNH